MAQLPLVLVYHDRIRHRTWELLAIYFHHKWIFPEKDFPLLILLMEEILHHPGCIKACKKITSPENAAVTSTIRKTREPENDGLVQMIFLFQGAVFSGSRR